MESVQKQILRTNFSTEDKRVSIDIIEYLNNYIKISSDDRIVINYIKSEVEIVRKINVFDFGVLIDNLIQNAIDNKASQLKIYFDKDMLHFESDTKFNADKDKVFDLGYTTKSNGSGIGLYMVKDICKEYDWGITVDVKESATIFQIKV